MTWGTTSIVRFCFSGRSLADSTFLLLILIQRIFRNYFQNYFRNYSRNYFQNSIQNYSVFLWMPITWGTTSNVRFFLSGRSLADPTFLLLVLVQRNTFSLPIRFFFRFPKLFPKLFLKFSEILANIISEIISAEGHLPDWSLWLNLIQQAETCWVQK